MAHLMIVEHAQAGQHVQLLTLNEPVPAIAMPYEGRFVLAVQLPVGSHLELKTSGGTLPVATARIGPAPRFPLPVLASSGLAQGQTMQLETPMGTLAVTGGDELAGPELEPEHFGSLDPISELAGGELPPPTQP
jgi:hypothetical protein